MFSLLLGIVIGGSLAVGIAVYFDKWTDKFLSLARASYKAQQKRREDAKKTDNKK